MKELKIKRLAYLKKDCVDLEYRIYKGEEFLRICELWKVFPSLSEEEVTEIWKEVRKDFDIPGARTWYINNRPIEIEVEVKKDKKVIKEINKKVMQLFKNFIKELEKEDNKKSLNDWLWKEREFSL